MIKILSQDKRFFGEVSSIRKSSEDYEEQEFVTEFLIFGYSSGGGVDLGYYKTKERRDEVFDKIIADIKYGNGFYTMPQE